MTRNQLLARGLKRDMLAVFFFILFVLAGKIVEHPPAVLDRWIEAHLVSRQGAINYVLPGFRLPVRVNFSRSFPAIEPDRRRWQIGQPPETDKHPWK